MSALERHLEQGLVRRGVPPERLAEARAAAERTGLTFTEALLRGEVVSAGDLAEEIARLTGLPLRRELDLEQLDIELLRRIPLGFARERGVLPLAAVDGVIEVAVAGPAALPALDDIRVMVRQPVRAVLVPADVLRDAINRAYDKAARTASAVFCRPPIAYTTPSW